ncbi:MAG: transferrin-binding protein-like solute binding protein [Nitrospira sp. SB0667_bin_9]|nr:transferrin-binding protein-like solute binding protein [Nitrospira sp. SB0667_bin_9]MYD30285.1 transferrin-binding protein-like solute binding protein [Nitrospira sp. SB0661_bin_20]MYJ22704.1 transferrin-binding protein-like solute binding protein [Nitrospira sp. SB0673_bin_12]
MTVNSFLVPMAALALLTACGGGGGGGGPAVPVVPDSPPRPEPPGMASSPQAVTATHLEMTDNVFVIREPGQMVAQDLEAQGTPVYTRARRDEVVCTAGGTSCTFPAGQDGGRNAHDGIWHRRNKERDASIEFHKNILAQSRKARQTGGIPAFRVDANNPSAEVYGGWGAWSTFYAVWERDSLNALDLTWSAAFGDLSDARPTAVQGSATWQGGMVGRTRADGIEVEGRSRLVYDFNDHSLDLTLEGIASSARAAGQGQRYSGQSEFVWTDLSVAADGTFGLSTSGNDRAGTDLHPTLGQVEGAFYGPEAGEAAGVFERGGVAGAFGARRE